MNYRLCWITLNRACNLRCKWCYAKGTNYSTSSDIELKTVYDIVDICLELNIKHVTLIGGEPTLYPHLIDVIKYIHSKGLKCGFVTNGVKLCNNKYVLDLMKCGIKHFSISLKGEDRETFKNVTGVDSFEDVLNGVKNCLNNDATVSVSVVLSEENIKTYLKGIKMMKSLGVSNFRLSFCYEYNATGKSAYLLTHNPRALIKNFIESYEELDKITNHKFTLQQSYPMCLWDEQFIDLLRKRNQITSICQLLNKSGLLFDTEANLIPCNAMYEIKLGKLYKDFNNVKELLKYVENEEFNRIYNKLCGVPAEDCLECSKLKYCGGGCVCQWTNYSFDQILQGYGRNG